MKKRSIAATAGILAAATARVTFGQVALPIYDPFNYGVTGGLTATGNTPLSGGSTWTMQTGTGFTPVAVDTATNLSYTGMPASIGGSIDPTTLASGSGGVTLSRLSYPSVATPATGGTQGALYYSMLMVVPNTTNMPTTTAGSFIAGFDNSTNAAALTPSATGSQALLRVRAIAGSTFQFGISRTNNAAAMTWSGNLTASASTTYLLVARINLVPGVNNDTANLWINPVSTSFGLSETDLTGSGPAATVNSVDTVADSAIQSFFVRQGQIGTTTAGNQIIDDLRIGSTWASVVPYAWSGASGSSFSTAGNWVLGSTPGAAIAPTFLGSATSKTVDLGGGGQTVSGLYINSSGAYTIGSSGQTLTVTTNDSSGVANVDAANGNHIINANVTLGSNISIGVLSNALTMSGTITETGGSKSLVKAGSGTLVLSNTNNNYTGTTTVSSGVLAIAGAGSLGPDPLTPTTDLFLGTATLRLEGDTTLVANRKIQIGVGGSGASTTFNTNGHSMTISGPITAATTSGSGFVKSGTGTLVLANDNSQPFDTVNNLGYMNSVTITGGTLNVTADNNLGKAATAVTLSGGTLQFASAFTDSARNLLLVPDNNFIDTGVNNPTWSGKVQNTGGAGRFTKIGSGTLTLSGTANNYTGVTTISAGTVRAGAAGAFSAGSDVTVGASTTLDANDFNNSVASLAGTGSVTTGIVGSTVLTVAGSTTATFAGQISGAGSLARSGTGTQVLSGTNNTYSNGTSVTGGVLLATNTGALPNYNVASSVAVGANATMAVSAGGAGQWASTDIDALLGAANWSASSLLGINVDSGNSFTYGTQLLNAQPGLNKIGGGTLAITNAANAYSAATVVTGGLLHFGSAGAYGSTSGVTVATGGGVGLDTGSRDLNFIAKINASATASTGALSLADATTDNGGAIDFNNNGLDGQMGGTKTIGMSIGAIGTVSYTGTITPPTTGAINLNTYALGGPNGTLVLPNTNAITGTGKNLKATNGGTVILSSTNDFNGTTTINGGTTLQVTNGSIGSTSSITIDGGTLQFGDNSGTDVPNAQIIIGANGGTIDTQVFSNNGYGAAAGMGGGVLTKLGTGTFSTSAGNTGGALTTVIAKQGVFQFLNEGQITGAGTNTTFTLDGGTVNTNSTWNATAAHAVSVTSNGGSLGVASGQTVSWTGAVSGSGSFTKVNAGTLVLRSGYTNSGSTNVTGGKLGLLSNALNTSAVSVSGSGSSLEMMTGGSQNRVLKTATVSTSSGGQINLQDNKMIVTTVGSLGTLTGSTYSGVTGLIQSGLASGAWTGTGIVTSQTNAGSTKQLTTLAVDTAGDAGKSTFGGQTVSSTDTLVMYTYAGDANLTGSITGDDYARIDAGFAAQSPSLSGYANGDFNYDGKINADDYFLIDKNYSAQGVTVIPAALPLGGVSAVPEPASLGLLMLAGMGLRRRRRTQA